MAGAPRRVVGIDLGTTNTVAATHVADGASSERARSGAVAVVPLVQHTDVSEVERLPQLPSVLYHALPEEPFHEFTPNRPWVVGHHARKRGTETPERVITSAKSWLCHTGVDRTAAILPWVSHAEDETSLPRISPVEASAAVLRQVCAGLADAGHPVDGADVVVTVPASFDQVARQLTVEAAKSAGLAVRLLEEPQAAFYDWLHRASHADVEALVSRRDGFVVLVVDIGGGTTDLTLLRVSARHQLSESERLTVTASELVAVERIAVGRHLLLGGDNIDLALAHLIERKLDAKKRLAPTEFSQLVASCQAAKERLLGLDPPSKVPIRLARRGSALFGNVLSAELSRTDVEALVFDGFLPDHDQNTPLKRGRSGLLSFGLPYESDPAITHHLGQFLTQHQAHVDGVLFNGGLFKSSAVAQRVAKILERWMGKSVLVLPNAAPDEAVARGAVHYGLALQGRGVKFTGGSAHGYYVAVDTTDASRKAVCVVPKGAPEDEWQRVDQLPLRLTVGKPVRFDLHSNAVEQHGAGQVVDLDSPHFEAVTSVGTRLTPETAQGRKPSLATSPDVIPVVLQGCLTPTGTLELACEAVDSRSRYELAFEVRGVTRHALLGKQGEPAAAQADGAGSLPSAATVPKPSTMPSAPPSGKAADTRATATEALHRVFGKGRSDVHAREVKDLWRDLERELGPRQSWDIGLCRSLSDVLLGLSAGRRRSVDHERQFFALAGFFLRPGFGHFGDADRMTLFEPLFEPGLAFPAERTNCDQFFIAWRRVAAGLTEAAQETIRAVCDPLIAPSELKLKKSKTFKAPEIPALWELLSWLERVSPERRASLGQWLLDRTWTSRDPKNWEWIGRVGAREPVYASAHHVVRTRHAEAWLEHLLSEPWETMPSAAWAAVQLARCTDDRARDINATLRERVASKLQNAGANAAWIDCVRQHVPREQVQLDQSFGEDLPPGLHLG